MSEKAPSTIVNAELPKDLDYDQLDMRTYKNGQEHVYGIDKDGKRRHISNDDVLEAYGYNPADSRENAKLMPNDTETATDIADSAETEVLPEVNEGDILMIPSFSRDPKKRGELTEFRVEQIYVNRDGDKEVKLISKDGEEDQRALYTAVQKHAANQPTETKTDEPEADNDGRYGFKGDDLFGGGREDLGTSTGSEDEPSKDLDKIPGTDLVPVKPSDPEANPDYDGPVTPGMDLEPWQEPGELVRLPEVDPDLMEQLDFARSRYAEATAKSRKSYIGRFLKTDTKVGGILAKIPGVKSIVSGWNKLKQSKGAQAVSKGIDSRFEAETLEAKTEYEKHYTRLAEATAKALEDVGWDAETVEQLSLIGNIQQDVKLEDEIVEQRESQGKSTNKFVNWWVNAKGIKGKLKKAAVVVAAGAATGLTGGLFLGATAAMIAGGAAGASIGVHVTRRRANSVDSEGSTLAQRQSVEDRAVKAVDIHVGHGRRMDGDLMVDADGNPIFTDRVGSVEDITGKTEKRTDEEMVGNRRRVRTATALGAAAGKGAFKIKQLFDKPPTDAPKPPKEPGPRAPKPHDPTEAPQPTPPEAPVRGLENFNVENGNGITHELMDFAEANGHQITPEQANHLYENLLSRLGPDNILSTRTYVRDAGDIGIGRPGMASWSPEAQTILSDLLKLR